MKDLISTKFPVSSQIQAVRFLEFHFKTLRVSYSHGHLLTFLSSLLTNFPCNIFMSILLHIRALELKYKKS